MAGSIPFLTLGLSKRDIRRLREHPSDSQTVRRLGPVSAVKISYVSTFKLIKVSHGSLLLMYTYNWHNPLLILNRLKFRTKCLP